MMKKRAKSEKIFTWTLDFDEDRLATFLCDAIKDMTLQHRPALSAAGAEADFDGLALFAVREVAPAIQQDFEEQSKRFAERFLIRAIYRAYRRAFQKMCEATGEQYTRSMDAIILKSVRVLSRREARSERNLPRLGSTNQLEPLTHAQLAQLAPKVDSVEPFYAAVNRVRVKRRNATVGDIMLELEPLFRNWSRDERDTMREVVSQFDGMGWIEGGEAVGPARMAQEHARLALNISERSPRSLESDVKRSRTIAQT